MASAKRDYYEVLGVVRTADGEEIKRSYRRLAMKYHPDRNPGDADAEVKFKECAEAYEVLSDPSKRQRYDQFGHQGVAGQHDFSHMDVGDIFSMFNDIFGGGFAAGMGGAGGGGRAGAGRAARGFDLETQVELTLAEIATGAEKTIEFERQDLCDSCKGSGAKPGTSPIVCPQCGGQGRVAQQGFGGMFRMVTTCPNCRGRGSVVREHCAACGGSGRQLKRRKVTVKIPAGVHEGQAVRITGEGEPGENGAPPGDLHCYVAVKQHPFFSRHNNDLVCQIPISFAQAALGSAIEVIQLTHRYAVVSPSLHPEGRPYVWCTVGAMGEMTPLEDQADGIPSLGDLAELPESWVQGIHRGEATTVQRFGHDQAAALAWIESDRGREACRRIDGARRVSVDRLHAPGIGRHDVATASIFELVRLHAEGHAGAFDALQAVMTAFCEVATDRQPSEAQAELRRLVLGALDRTPMPAATPDDPCVDEDRREAEDKAWQAALVAQPQAPRGEPAPPAVQPAESDGKRRARVTWASSIKPRPVVWAWTTDDQTHGRMPAGALSLAAGREGTGKSSFGIWLAAQITRGRLPGSFHGKPRRVLYVAVEDSWQHTLVPRLIAAGADLESVGRFEVVRDDQEDLTLSLPADNAELEQTIREHDVALVVIDPVMSVISATVDTHRERDVRTALDPLAKIADRTGCVVLGLAHFNKSAGTDASQLITGSGAFKNVPRAVFGFARDDEEGTRVMTQVKNSLGRDDLPSLSYGIQEVTIPTDYGPATTSRFTFTGESQRSVADVLRDNRNGPADEEDRDEREQVADWLQSYLASRGGEATFNDVQRAGNAQGFKDGALKRAKRKAGVRSRKDGMSGGWLWVLTVEGSTEGDEENGLPFSAPFVPFALPSRTCEVCGQPMTPTAAEQTTHPGCTGRDAA